MSDNPKAPNPNDAPIEQVQTRNPQQPMGLPNEQRRFEQIQRHEQERPPPQRNTPRR